MSRDEERRFAFTSKALRQDAFEVVSFTGREALSEPYAFDVVLVSKKDDLDPETVIGTPAAFTLYGQDGTFTYNGLTATFEQTGKVDDLAFYRARLVPRLHLLTLGENCRIFLDLPPNVFLEQVMVEEGLVAGLDFEFRLTGSSLSRPFVAQFRETTLAFVNRWLEREGLYYFFEQSPAGTKMVITDAKSVHQPLPGKSEFRYETPSGLVVPREEEAVFAFRRCLRPMPESVLLKDWRYETPSVDISASARVLAGGHGAVRIYGDHCRSIDEARTLAGVRAEALLCHRDVAEGESAFPGLTVGRLMRLTKHFQNGCNREYLLTAVRHQGRQFGFLTAGLGLAHEADGAPETFYRNAFTAIPSDVQFRPERTTPWPRLEGLVGAVIDGAGSGKYAEVDEQGRYKVKVAYDLSGRQGGKASAWLRMAQPYGGSGHGLHFPLHKGCEVVLACQDGDPDRPVILGAVPNPEHKSVVTSANHTRVNLETSGGNQLYFEDQDGSKRALFQSKPYQTFMRLGAPNDPWFESETEDEKKEAGQEGIAIKTPHGANIVVGSMLQTYMIGYFETMGFLQVTSALTETAINVGLSQEISGYHYKTRNVESEIKFIAEKLHISETRTEANKKHLVDELIIAKGRISALDGEMRTLQGDINGLEGDYTILVRDITQLSQERSRLCGDLSELTQRQIDLTDSNETLAGTVQDLAKSKIKLHGEVTTLAGDVSNLTRETTALDTQRTELIDNMNKTGAEIWSMSDLDVTL
ncbi:MAG: type VI secretion system Vgr family protein [Solidesulfovibrio sp.]